MPRARMPAAMVQRGLVQQVAAQTRDTAGAVATVLTVAETIDGAVDGGLVATLNSKLTDFDARIAALEP